jgi:hypothetical protein
MPSNDPLLGGGRDAEHRLQPIEGSPPDLFHPPKGCAYAPRCPYAMRICSDEDPGPFHQSERHFARCWLHHSGAPRVPELHQRAGRSEPAAAKPASTEPAGSTRPASSTTPLPGRPSETRR